MCCYDNHIVSHKHKHINMRWHMVMIIKEVIQVLIMMYILSTYIYIYICMHACMYIYIYICIYKYVYIYMYVYVYIYIYMYVYVYIYVYMYTYMYTICFLEIISYNPYIVLFQTNPVPAFLSWAKLLVSMHLFHSLTHIPAEAIVALQPAGSYGIQPFNTNTLEICIDGPLSSMNSP